jgi:hypothetical protein
VHTESVVQVTLVAFESVFVGVCVVTGTIGGNGVIRVLGSASNVVVIVQAFDG